MVDITFINDLSFITNFFLSNCKKNPLKKDKSTNISSLKPRYVCMHHTHHYVKLSGTIKANCWSCYIAFMASDEEMAIKKPQMVFWRLEQQGSRIVYFQTLGECFHFSSLLNLWRAQFITTQLFCIITSKLNKIFNTLGAKQTKMFDF